jgi:hypothetical protein
MAILDGPLQKVAQTLIGRFGQDVVLKEVITGNFQVATNTVGNTPIEHPVKAVVPKKVSREGQSLMKEGDQVHLVAAGALPGKVPTTNWLLISGDRELEIVGVTPVIAGDEAAMYEIISRGYECRLGS